MTALTENKISAPSTKAQDRVKMRLLEQMAEALEDEASALYRRAAAFEEEEFILSHELGERQTEINRLLLKIEAMRAERDRVTDRIETISLEAIALREEAFNGQRGTAESSSGKANDPDPVFTNGDPARSAMFFRRVTPVEHVGRA